MSNFVREAFKSFELTSVVSSLISANADYANFTVMNGSGVIGAGIPTQQQASHSYGVFGRLISVPALRPQFILTLFLH